MAIESLESLRDLLREFAKDRDWDQYHTPKNLSMALIAEAAELVVHFQWVSEDIRFRELCSQTEERPPWP